MKSAVWLIERFVLTGSALVTLIVLPNSYDPVNIPKLLTLAILIAVVSFKLSIQMGKSKMRFDSLDVVTGLFAFLLLLNLAINRTAFSERLYGVSGRSTGFIYFFSLVLLFFLVRQLRFSAICFFKYIAGTSLMVSAVLILQSKRLIPSYFQEFYAASTSTLGNPNFVSGFLGFSTPCLILVFNEIKNAKIRFLLLSSTFSFNLWAIYETKSIQGFIALFATLFIYACMRVYFYYSRRHLLQMAIFLISGICFTLFYGKQVVELVGSSSTFSRLDYWRAAVTITQDFPVWGVGLDAYGDYYRLFRDEVAFNRFGEGQISDSPHNIFLDCFVSGGVPLGITFIALNLLPLIYFLRKNTLGKRLNSSEILLVSIWVGYQVQAFITVNQIGVSIWNWVLLGLLAQKTPRNLMVFKSNQKEISASGKVPNLIPLLLGVSLTLLMTFPLKNHLDIVSAAKYSNGSKLLEVAQRFPKDSKIMASVAMGANTSGLESLSLEILRKAVKHNPRSFYLWKLLLENNMASQAEQSEAKSIWIKEIMQELDPLYKFPGG